MTDQQRKIVVSLKDIYSVFALAFRDHTNQKYKQHRDRVKKQGVCPICGEPIGSKKIQAIHKHGFSRKEIVKKIIGDKSEVDFDLVVEQYRDFHRSHKLVAIGCQTCHRDYGTTERNCKRAILDSHFITLSR